MRALLALVLLAALLPQAAAQLPIDPCGAPTLTLLGPTAPVPQGGQAAVSATVGNPGQAQMRMTVVAATTSSEWSLVEPTEQAFDLAAGAQRTVNFTIQASANAVGAAQVTVSGQGDCASGVPGGCPNAQACVRQLPSRSLTVEVERASGFRLPGLDAIDFPLEYLAAGILLVAVAVAIPLLARKRRPVGPAVQCPEPLKRVKPGRGASFPIELRNPNETPLKLDLAVGAVPDGWSAFLPVPDMQLAARETRSVWLMVRAPPEARAGQACDVDVTASDAQHPQRKRVVKMRAEVDEDATGSG